MTAMAAPDWNADPQALLRIVDAAEDWWHAVESLPATLAPCELYITVLNKARALAWALRPVLHAKQSVSEHAWDARNQAEALADRFLPVMRDCYGLRVFPGAVNRSADPMNPTKVVYIEPVDLDRHRNRLVGMSCPDPIRPGREQGANPAVHQGGSAIGRVGDAAG
jgi:hypothetical protein